jgi:hypothetical protein
MVLHITPYGFECELEDCPAGPFLFKSGDHFGVGFKSEYGDLNAFNEAGEYYHGKGKVQPAIYEWKED